MQPFANDPSFTLLPEGAVFLTSSRTLVVADLHLGKSATFRARGLPVPEGDTARDLARLLDLCQRWSASHLVIAGDLFHAPVGVTPDLEAALACFREKLIAPVTLVLGNHDAKLPRIPNSLQAAPWLDLADGLRVIHDPADASGERLHLCGHLHPVVKIPDGKRSSLRLPCFFLRQRTLILPTFGSFTGGAAVSPAAGDRVFVTLADRVVELPDQLIG
ncbi:MAG TPA: ligase-associated DNA damage response endonuclease PdeM [Chthoniobacteraceae bacterium]|jgi:DNA ligase-associated metallophosphoesterase